MVSHFNTIQLQLHSVWMPHSHRSTCLWYRNISMSCCFLVGFFFLGGGFFGWSRQDDEYTLCYTLEFEKKAFSITDFLKILYWCFSVSVVAPSLKAGEKDCYIQNRDYTIDYTDNVPNHFLFQCDFKVMSFYFKLDYQHTWYELFINCQDHISEMP